MLGRVSGAGMAQEITIGDGLVLDGTTLKASVGASSGTMAAGNDIRFRQAYPSGRTIYVGDVLNSSDLGTLVNASFSMYDTLSLPPDFGVNGDSFAVIATGTFDVEQLAVFTGFPTPPNVFEFECKAGFFHVFRNISGVWKRDIYERKIALYSTTPISGQTPGNIGDEIIVAGSTFYKCLVGYPFFIWRSISIS